MLASFTSTQLERMARPVCKGVWRSALVSLRQRIRSRGRTPAKMEIRAARSS
jgi:transposase